MATKKATKKIKATPEQRARRHRYYLAAKAKRKAAAREAAAVAHEQNRRFARGEVKRAMTPEQEKELARAIESEKRAEEKAKANSLAEQRQRDLARIVSVEFRDDATFLYKSLAREQELAIEREAVIIRLLGEQKSHREAYAKRLRMRAEAIAPGGKQESPSGAFEWDTEEGWQQSGKGHDPLWLESRRHFGAQSSLPMEFRIAGRE